MSEMKLIMESWRAFRLVEQQEPKFKEDPQDTIALLSALATEPDKHKVEKVVQQIIADKDVEQVMSALEHMFQELTDTDEVEVDIAEDLDDLGRSVAAMGLGVTDKVDDFLSNTTAGRLLGKVAPPILGLAMGALMLQGGEITPGGLKTVSKLIAGGVNPESLGDAMADIGAETFEALQERKKN